MEYVEILGGTGGGATASKGFDPTSLITSLVTTGIGIAFQILAIEKNEALIKGLEKDKYKSIVLVSVSTLVLAVVIFMAKKRKK